MGGAALVMTEMTCTSPDGRITPGCPGMYKPEHLAGWTRIVDFVHANSQAKIGMQIGHAGAKASTRLAWEGIDQPLKEGNWEIISASPQQYVEGVSQTAREMNRADMIVSKQISLEQLKMQTKLASIGLNFTQLTVICSHHLSHHLQINAQMNMVDHSKTECATQSKSLKQFVRFGHKESQ
jgi:anthraniloyl-CoA monooxygenase